MRWPIYLTKPHGRQVLVQVFFAIAWPTPSARAILRPGGRSLPVRRVFRASRTGREAVDRCAGEAHWLPFRIATSHAAPGAGRFSPRL